MSRRRKYTDDQFRGAVRTSESIAQVMNKLGLSSTGGNYTHFKVIAMKLGVDYSHFTGRAHLRGKQHNWTPKIPLEEVLIKNSGYSRGHLKRRLINAGLLREHCTICGISDWQEKPLSLHIDHVNGDPLDHRLENLRLLCPNCHSQTDTYAGKNKKSPETAQVRSRCINCNKTISRNARRCKSCAGKESQQQKIEWPSMDDLILMIEATSYTTVAKRLGVSDNAIRKHIKKHPMKNI